MISDKVWVVGIGASAGGLEALTQFVSGLPSQSKACYVVAQHLAPHAKSMMVELVSRQSPIRVDVVVSGCTLEPNRLFIVPPNNDVDIVDNKLILTKAGEETRPKPSVDRFFTSLARAFGSHAVGVVLSGTGSDGAEGIRAIKAAGGVTAAQAEGSAKFSGMPNAAGETGQVDLILPPAEIARRLSTIVDNNHSPFEKEPDDTDPSFAHVLQLIQSELGRDFSQYKNPTIKRRLSKRMFAVDAPDVAAYLEILRHNSNELRTLAQEFLVSVTSFFRDTEAFAALAECVRSIIGQKNREQEIRVWSAGCATGEEAYSLAMLFYDNLTSVGAGPALKVFATDLDTEAITKARVGLYHERDLETLPADFREKYFDPRGDMFEVKKFLRDHVIFARQDLIQSPPFVKLDLVCCRNVLIYFEPKLQQKLLEIFSYALKSGGVLFLGKSETIAGAVELFEAVDKKAKIFLKKASAPRTLPQINHPRPATADVSSFRKRVINVPSPQQMAQRQMLERHGITGAIVDLEGKIQTVLGDVSKFLKVTAGLESFDLPAMLPRSASVEFQLLMRKAIKAKSLQRSRAFKLSESGSELFQIFIGPLDSREDASQLSPALLLVTFENVNTRSVVVNGTSASDGDLALRAAELEQELSATKEHLQTVIEELGVTNEELQSTNEELSSTNEELQSSNEELETTNEEFQSTNEELTTLNEELGVKSSEMRSLNMDLENIQVSIGVPLLVIDETLRLQRFNPSTTELFDISANDVGRPLNRLSCRCEIESFTENVQRVIQTGQAAEFAVNAYRSVYQMRISPRRNLDNRVVGAVILFFNNTDLIHAEQNLRQSEERIRSIIDGTSALIFQKDLGGRYIAVNRAFLDYFGLDDKNILGKSDRDLFDENFSNQLRDGELEAVLKRGRTERQEDFNARDKTGIFLVNRFPLGNESSTTPYAIVTVAINITAQVSAQKALTKSESLYRGVVEDQSVFVIRFSPHGKVTFANAAFIRYFGGGPNDYLGQPYTSFIDVVDRAYVKEELNRLSLVRPVIQFEHRFTRFDSIPRWIRWINKAVLNESGEVQEVQAVGFDVTEYRQQTDQMVQREMLFSNIFTYTTDFLTVFKVTGAGELLLESFNRSVDDGGVYPYAQFLGRNVRELITSDHRGEILEKYRLVVSLKEPQSFDEELSVQGSTKYLSTTVIPVINHEGNVERVVTLSRDVSKYKIAEAELNTAKAAAEIANETKSDFLASMSHELRSPLNVVIGMAELLEESSLSAVEREQVKSILRSGKVLLTLIEDILDISKIEAGKTKLEFASFSLPDLVKDVIEAFRPQISAKGILVSAKLPGDGLDDFVGDVNRIRQILTNLVGNAIKFTEQGGVEVKVSSVGHKTTGRRLVRFDIKDTGIGIPEEYHSRIFKKFSQVDTGLNRRFGGTGLGLVICQRLTTLMHGQIAFTSEWNKGSNFWFELPLTIAQKAVSSEKSAPAIAPKSGPVVAKILAVDDNPDGRMLLEMLMKRLGHDCEMVDSGEAAIEAITKNDYDLVLMDVQMPGMTGYEATTRIRKLDHANASLPIIALTANAMVGDSEKCFDSGMNDYVTKPINFDILRSTIAKWASGAAHV